MADKTYEEFYEEQWSRKMSEGKAVRMYRTTRGWQYIKNSPQHINRAKMQSYVPEDVAVAAGVPLGPCGSHKGYPVETEPMPKPKMPEESKPKRGPGRPRKTTSKASEAEAKDGE